MLHGQVVRPPAVGSTLVNVDENSVKGLPGVVKVVVKKNFVGVVAEKPWQAIQAANKLKVVWTPGQGLPKQSDIHDYLRNKKPVRDTYSVNSKDVEEKLARAAKIVKATYLYPYQMHGSIGSSCAVADIQGTKATVWSATQAVYPLRSTVAMVLGTQPENGHVITGFLAGFDPAAFAPRTPAPDPANFTNGNNAVPSYVVGSVNGKSGGTGNVRGERVLSHDVPSPFWTGPLRSPARLQNTFAHESFIDEVAAQLKADPVEYRLRHLSDPRLMDVVKGAAKAANWDSRPSPRNGARRA